MYGRVCRTIVILMCAIIRMRSELHTVHRHTPYTCMVARSVESHWDNPIFRSARRTHRMCRHRLQHIPWHIIKCINQWTKNRKRMEKESGRGEEVGGWGGERENCYCTIVEWMSVYETRQEIIFITLWSHCVRITHCHFTILSHEEKTEKK